MKIYFIKCYDKLFLLNRDYKYYCFLITYQIYELIKTLLVFCTCCICYYNYSLYEYTVKSVKDRHISWSLLHSN